MTQSTTIPNFNIMGTTGSIIFKIPISKKKWWEFWKKDNLSDIIKQYKEEVNFDDKSGEIFINKSSLPFRKYYWF